MPAYFLDPDAWGAGAALTGGEAVHCARVMRARPGDQISVFDGRGRGAEAEIVAVSRGEVTLKLGPITMEPPPSLRITLGQAVLKGKAMEWLLQKAVELGVDEIQALQTRRVVVKAEADKLDKWRRIALEACKQCGRRRLPTIHPVRDFQEWIPEPGGPRLIAALSGETRPLRDVIGSWDKIDSATLLIGPEGDFTPQELGQARDFNWVPVSLGRRVLRGETAALFGLSALRLMFP